MSQTKQTACKSTSGKDLVEAASHQRGPQEPNGHGQHQEAVLPVAGHPGLWEIQGHKWSTEPPVPKLSIQRLVWEIMQDLKMDLHLQRSTVMVLHEVSEAHLVGLSEDTNLCAIHARSVTIMTKDIQLTCCIHWNWAQGIHF